MKTVTMSLEEFRKYEDYERVMTKLESTNNKHYSQGVSDAVIFLKEYLISKRNNPYLVEGDENYKKVLDLAKELAKDQFRKWEFKERVLSRETSLKLQPSSFVRLGSCVVNRNNGFLTMDLRLEDVSDGGLSIVYSINKGRNFPIATVWKPCTTVKQMFHCGRPELNTSVVLGDQVEVFLYGLGDLTYGNCDLTWKYEDDHNDTPKK